MTSKKHLGDIIASKSPELVFCYFFLRKRLSFLLLSTLSNYSQVPIGLLNQKLIDQSSDMPKRAVAVMNTGMNNYPESTADFRPAGRTSGSLAGTLRRACGDLAGKLRSDRIGESALFGSSVSDFDADCTGTPVMPKHTPADLLPCVGLAIVPIADEPAVRPAIGRRSARKLPQPRRKLTGGSKISGGFRA